MVAAGSTTKQWSKSAPGHDWIQWVTWCSQKLIRTAFFSNADHPNIFTLLYNTCVSVCVSCQWILVVQLVCQQLSQLHAAIFLICLFYPSTRISRNRAMSGPFFSVCLLCAVVSRASDVVPWMIAARGLDSLRKSFSEYFNCPSLQVESESLFPVEARPALRPAAGCDC